MKSMVDLSHEFLKPVLHKQAICVDATLGQGKDTNVIKLRQFLNL